MANSSSERKHLILDVLDGNYDRETATMDKVELRNFSLVKMPRFNLNRILWFVNILIGLSFGALFLYQLKDNQALGLLQLGFGGIFLLFVLWLTIWAIRRHKSHSAFIEIITPPFNELVELRNSLKEYLQVFDKRTSRYFHCVTNSKVTAYYVLSQMNSEMTKLIDELTELLAQPNYKNLGLATFLLQGSLVISDSLVVDVGKTHLVPLERLYPTMLQIVDNLEDAIISLEDDIRSHVERSSDLDEPDT